MSSPVSLLLSGDMDGNTDGFATLFRDPSIFLRKISHFRIDEGLC